MSVERFEQRFTFTAGAVVRRRIMRQIMTGAVRHRVEMRFTEDKALLDSFYSCTVAGEQANVEGFIVAFKDYVERLTRELEA